MLTRAWMESRYTSSTTPDTAPAETTGRHAKVVDLQDWRLRRALLRRGFTPGLCEYVPRHRAEAALGN